MPGLSCLSSLLVMPAGRFKLLILGVINHQSVEANNPITISEPHSPAAEAYRTGYEMRIIPTIYTAIMERLERSPLVGSTPPAGTAANQGNK